MPGTKSRTRTKRTRAPRKPGKDLRALERRLARLTAAEKAARGRYARELAAVRRTADRQLAGMLSEIAALRHHEARTQALQRLLEERDRRISELEALLRSPTQLG